MVGQRILIPSGEGSNPSSPTNCENSQNERTVFMYSPKTVFLVDDNDVNLLMAKKALSQQYNVYTLPSAAGMFELLENVVPDIILLDINMPEMNGFEALKLLKANGRYREIPVIFLTIWRDSDIESKGFEMGVVDFISKPFSESVLFNRIKTHLDIEDRIHEQTVILKQRSESLYKLKTSMVSVLSEMLESRDKTTGGHVERTAKYVRILVQKMIERGVYADEITCWDFDVLASSVRLHDVGKIAISDLILNKPDPLTREEFEIMKIHAAEGERIIDKMISQAGDEDFLICAKQFTGYHHERWDGTGYPHGLKGEDIPLLGRIMAIADVYDALVSERPYKKVLTHEQAVAIIIESKGKQFDPKLVDIFCEVSEQFAEVSSCR